jgi:hypothetical protein
MGERLTPRKLRTGEKITQAGVYALSIEDYHGQPCDGPSVSSSGLRTIFKASPAHFWCESSLNPDRIERAEPGHFALGRAAHHLLLGEDDFSTLFIVRPEIWDSWRTDAAKDWKAEQEAEGRTVLVPDQIEVIRGMARSLAAHPLVRAGILNGEIERSLVWRDKETGVWLKARPDAIPNASGDFADLKTTASIGVFVDADVGKYRYDMQAALVKWAARVVLGIDMESFSFVFVEKSPPHSVDVLTLSSDDIAEAEKDLHAALRTFEWCHRTGNWFHPSGYQSDARYVHISDRVRENAKFRREFLMREITPRDQAAE